MDKAYTPGDIERRIYERWETSGAFAPAGEGSPYCIMLPPPTATSMNRTEGQQATSGSPPQRTARRYSAQTLQALTLGGYWRALGTGRL